MKASSASGLWPKRSVRSAVGVAGVMGGSIAQADAWAEIHGVPTLGARGPSNPCDGGHRRRLSRIARRFAMRPTARILSATLLIAVLAVTAWGAPRPSASKPALSEADRAAATGQWFLDPDDDPGMVQFSLRMSSGRDHQSWSSESTRLESLDGLSSEDVRGSNVAVAFQLRRDAGTLFARGTVTRGKGAGTFDLVLDPAFARELERRGVGRPTEAQQIQLAIGDVSLGLLDDLRESHYLTPDVDLLVRCVHHGVNREFVRGLYQLGYRMESVEQLVTARDHGVDPEFIRGMREAGYRDLEFR